MSILERPIDQASIEDTYGKVKVRAWTVDASSRENARTLLFGIPGGLDLGTPYRDHQGQVVLDCTCQSIEVRPIAEAPTGSMGLYDAVAIYSTSRGRIDLPFALPGGPSRPWFEYSRETRCFETDAHGDPVFNAAREPPRPLPAADHQMETLCIEWYVQRRRLIDAQLEVRGFADKTNASIWFGYEIDCLRCRGLICEHVNVPVPPISSYIWIHIVGRWDYRPPYPVLHGLPSNPAAYVMVAGWLQAFPNVGYCHLETAGGRPVTNWDSVNNCAFSEPRPLTPIGTLVGPDSLAIYHIVVRPPGHDPANFGVLNVG